MRVGERNILIIMAAVAILLMVYRGYQIASEPSDPGIPFYTTASPELKRQAELVYKDNNCSDCHSLWTVRNMSESVPAPRLDGIGSLRDEQWFYDYFSAQDPQAVLPSRLKKEYKMPSFAHLPEQDRRLLAAYMSSLKVEDWYLEETMKSEFEKLTGNKMPAEQ